MSFDSGPLDRYLCAAVGSDRQSADALRHDFVDSARKLVDLMQRARCDANWRVAAERLKGMAATFGVILLIELAEEAMAGAPGDPAVVKRISQVLATLS